MNSKRQVTISFQFPSELKSRISSWISSCALFFSTTLMDTDSKLATSLLTESLKSRVSDTETEIVFEDALEPLAVHVLVQQILLLGM